MTKPRTSTRRERFLPYAHARNASTLSIDRVIGDEATPDRTRHLVELDQSEWTQVELHCSVTEPPVEVFPDDERENPPAQALVVIRCEATRSRFSVRCDAQGKAQVSLQRANVWGTVELRPVWVRTRARPPATGFAHELGARVAEGRAWSVRVDRQRDAAGRFLDTRWQKFSDDAELVRHRDTLFRLQIGDQPVLWINADHEDVRRVLDDRGTRGPRARTRDAVFDLVAQSVWTQLFVQAASDLALGDGLVWGWEHSVLRELLPSLIPNARTHAARLDSLIERLEREELPDLVVELASVLQSRHRLAEHLSKLIGEIAA